MLDFNILDNASVETSTVDVVLLMKLIVEQSVQEKANKPVEEPGEILFIVQDTWVRANNSFP